MIPDKVHARRANLTEFRKRQDARLSEMRDRHELEIRSVRELFIEIDAELAGLAFADAAYAEQAPEQSAEPEPGVRKSRAARRDIRGMVLDAVRDGPGGKTVDALCRALGARPVQVRAAIEHWAEKGDMTLSGDGRSFGRYNPDPALPASIASPAEMARAAE